MIYLNLVVLVNVRLKEKNMIIMVCLILKLGSYVFQHYRSLSLFFVFLLVLFVMEENICTYMYKFKIGGNNRGWISSIPL